MSGEQTREGAGLGACDAEAAVSEFGKEKHAEMRSRKADVIQALSLKNRRAKMLMAEELLRMGFSREAACRVLNINLDNKGAL